MSDTEEWFVIVDVGCIECGEQTEVVGVYATEDEAKAAFEAAATARVAKWEPRGGILEFLGLHGKSRSTYLGGCGYFAGGQHALELHVVPARILEPADAAR